jgi:hypothetical protein
MFNLPKSPKETWPRGATPGCRDKLESNRISKEKTEIQNKKTLVFAAMLTG